MADRNLLLRVASAAVALPLLGALVLWHESLGFALFALAVGALALCEYAGLLLRERPARERAGVVAVGVGLACAMYARPDLAAPWTMVAMVVVGALAVSSRGDPAGAAARLAAAGFGVFYVGGLVTALPLLKRDAADGSLWVVVALAVTFANDTGSYFVGRAFGKHKLAPVISPGKTVEGAVGGLLAGLACMFAARASFFPGLSLADCLYLGTAAGVLGPIGDLVESLLKRSAGVKDSSRLVPGHGGVLDRIDAVLFVGGFMYFYVNVMR